MTLSELKPIAKQCKTDLLRQRLTVLARDLGPGKKFPTVRDLASRLQVSSATLDRSFKELELRGVIRRRPGKGIFVSPRAIQKTIGLVFGHKIFEATTSPVYAMLLKHCEQRAKSHSENFSFYMDFPEASGGDEPQPAHWDLIEDIRSGKLNGILQVSRNAERERWLRLQKVPVVTYGVDTHGRGFVDVDWGELVRLGVEALAAQDCKRIGMITPFGYWRPSFQEDMHAFVDTLQRRGLEFRAEWIWEQRVSDHAELDDRCAEMIEKCGGWEEQGYWAVKALFNAKGGNSNSPDGLVIVDDLVARRALVEAGKIGIVAGRDVRVATLANRGSPILRGLEDQLTLLEIDPQEIVEAMFSLLEKRMTGKQPSPEPVFIKPKITGRGGFVGMNS